MAEQAARTARVELPSFSAPYYIWEPAGKPVSVAVPMSMIDELEREAVESFRCLTSKGSEIGGVLFGKTTPGNPAQVVLVSYELIPCDYARGPLYRMADADLSRLDRAVADAAGSGHTVAGFFRSNTRKSIAIDTDDLTVLETRFAGPHHVALLIRPFAAKPSVGGFFIREGGQIQGEQSALEFSFRADQLTASALRATSAPQAPAAAPAPEPKAAVRAQIVPIASRREPAAEAAPPPAPSIAPPPPPALKITPPVAKPAPAAAAKPAPAQQAPAAKPAPAAQPAPAPQPKPAAEEKKKAAAPVSAPPKPEPEAAPAPETTAEVETATVAAAAANKKKVYTIGGAALALLIGAGLFITPAVLHRGTAKATLPASLPEASLTLRVERSGGELLLTWNRDSQAIRGASRAVLQISDGPQHDNVEMDLAQLRNGSIVYSPVTSDVVFKMEVTGASGNATASESVRVLSSRPSPLAGADGQAPNSASKSPATAQATPPQAANGDAAPEESKPVAPTKPLKAFNAQSLGQRLRPANQNDLPEALVASASAPATTLPGLNLGSNAAAPPPVAPAPTPAAPAPAAKSGGQIQPAELVKRRDPEYPKLARDAGAKGVVQLTATVGADGHVKAVKVVKGHPLLIRAATDAVMQWIYRPTILNGVAVETTTDVTLNFVNER